MKSLVVACAAGKIDGTIVLDLGKAEDNFGQADMPMGIVPETGEIVLMQMDGNFSKEEFSKAYEHIIKGVAEIHEKQRQALKERYETAGDTDEQ
jgi:exosome complex component RRP41